MDSTRPRPASALLTFDQWVTMFEAQGVSPTVARHAAAAAVGDPDLAALDADQAISA